MVRLFLVVHMVNLQTKFIASALFPHTELINKHCFNSLTLSGAFRYTFTQISKKLQKPQTYVYGSQYVNRQPNAKQMVILGICRISQGSTALLKSQSLIFLTLKAGHIAVANLPRKIFFWCALFQSVRRTNRESIKDTINYNGLPIVRSLKKRRCYQTSLTKTLKLCRCLICG